jgi:hypothetical protein
MLTPFVVTNRGYEASVLSRKFDEKVDHALPVIPAEAGIQMVWKFLDSGSRSCRQLARNDDRFMFRISGPGHQRFMAKRPQSSRFW